MSNKVTVKVTVNVRFKPCRSPLKAKPIASYVLPEIKPPEIKPPAMNKSDRQFSITAHPS
jgi:hypothetical protein